MEVAQTLKSQSRRCNLPRVKNFMFISDLNPLPNISIGILRHQTGTTNYRSTTPNASRIRLPNPPVHAKPALGSNAASPLHQIPSHSHRQYTMYLPIKYQPIQITLFIDAYTQVHAGIGHASEYCLYTHTSYSTALQPLPLYISERAGRVPKKE